MSEPAKKTYSFVHSLVMLLLAIATIVVGKLVFSFDTTLVLLCSTLITSIYGCLTKVPWKDIQDSMVSGFKSIAVPVIMLLEIGIDAIKPWGHVGDIGAAIMEHAHKNGYTVVRDFAGHGVGNGFHEDPIVPHVGMRGTGMVLAPGMVITVEPMINAGSWELFIDEDNGWTAYTCDGSLSAQWEHTIYIGEHGVEIIAY